MYKILLIFLAIDVNSAKKIGRIDRFEICDTSKDPGIFFTNTRVYNPPGENVLVSLTGTAVRDLPTTLRLKGAFTRCRSREALDNCENFKILNSFSTCQIMSIPNMAWTDFIRAIEPPLVCPIKQGDYVLTNGTLNADLFNIFPLDNFYWKLNLTFFEGNEYVTVCLDFRTLNVYN